jgi:hypothetical protein
MKSNNKFFIITGIFGLVLVVVSSCLIFVKNSFGFDVFASSNRDCVPYNVFVSKGDNNYSVDISWSTRKDCVGFIQYGNQRDSLNSVAIDQKNKVKSNAHEVIVDDLLTSEKYYFLVNSDDVAYGYNGSAIDFSIKNL